MSADGAALVLLGSARSDGHTAAACTRFAQALLPSEIERVDLVTLNLAPFRYAHASDDDVSFVISGMLAHHTIVFATFVYWYAMSGLMKTLFDRLSDILSDRDPARRGRRLAGRDVWLLATGTDASMPAGFEVPFARTAA